MKEITADAFINLFNSTSVAEIKNYIINDEVEIDIAGASQINCISNCFFNNKFYVNDTREFEKNAIIDNCLIFIDCVFQNFIMEKCHFDELKFMSIKSSGNSFSILESEISEFKIENSIIENDIISLYNNNILNEFHIKKLETKKGNFYLLKNKFCSTQNSFSYRCVIDKCQLYNCNINDNEFATELFFTNNILSLENHYSKNSFNNCVFNSISFDNTDFGDTASFHLCKFNNATLFDSIKSEIKTDLTFKHCRFKSSSSFRKAKIHRVHFDHCVFENSTFFQEAYFDIIKIDNSIFEKNVFFDDIQIKEIDKCDRRTIRNIKLHLQKAENRIDYNKFRVHEFEAYKKEIRKQIASYKKDKNHFLFRKRQIKDFKRDLFILKVSGLFSNYGTDWKRALKATLLFGLILYIPFFIFENFGADWDLSNWQIAPIGFLRFFILTDFYSPLKDGRTYIDMDGWNHLVSWLIFILGKIVIAFGIYEMIQAFRKFKA